MVGGLCGLGALVAISLDRHGKAGLGRLSVALKHTLASTSHVQSDFGDWMPGEHARLLRIIVPAFDCSEWRAPDVHAGVLAIGRDSQLRVVRIWFGRARFGVRCP